MATYTVTDGQSQSFTFMPADRNGEADLINTSGAASIDATVASAPAAEALTVALASGAQLTAGFHFLNPTTLTINGDGSTAVIDNGTSNLGTATTAYIQPNVTGSGSFDVGAGSELEFAGGVASGNTVNLLSGQPGNTAILALDQPGAFKGAVNFTDGLVALRGLAQPTDFDLSNGVLTIYGGSSDQALDTLRITDNSPEKAGISVSLLNGEVDITEQTGNGPFGGGTALAHHVAPPPAPQNVAIHDNTTGTDLPDTSSAYTGPVAGISSQLINITPDNLNVMAKTDSLFIKTGAGNDAVALHGGTNVVDAGTGSNFLTSGSGFDTFFLDARNIPAAASAAGPVPGAIWDTIQGFGHGDAATLWGVGPGTALAWQKNEGAVGHTGLTLHANMPNGAEASLTLAGVDNTSHLALSYGQTGGANYLYIKAT